MAWLSVVFGLEVLSAESGLVGGASRIGVGVVSVAFAGVLAPLACLRRVSFTEEAGEGG